MPVSGSAGLRQALAQFGLVDLLQCRARHFGDDEDLARNLEVRELFAALIEKPELLPADWQVQLRDDCQQVSAKARLVCDYIAGMTDRFAAAEHKRLFDHTPDLR